MDINYLAAVVAALSSFFIGGLWYSPMLFQKAWMQENGFKEEDLKSNLGKVFGLSFVSSLIMAFNLAAFLGDSITIVQGATYGGLAGFGWIAMAYSITYLFERKSLKLWLINAGYHIVSFTLMGGILGAW